MKQITIIGATNGVGLNTVELALNRGYIVKALSRNFENYPISSPNLIKIEGNALNEQDCLRAIEGSGTVILSIGAKITLKPVTLYSSATETIIKTIQENQPETHLITVTGFGAGNSKGHNSFFANIFLFGFLLKTGYEDKTKQEELILNSKLPYTIVRPAVLTDGPLLGFYNVYNEFNHKLVKISRADVADFILKEAENRDHLYQTPLITY